MKSLVIKELSKNFNKNTILNQLNLELQQGIYGLLGPNGAGKTTLMRILTTLIPYNKGSISYGDLTWENSKSVRKIIGYLPQKFSLYKNIRVIEALEHIAILKGINLKKFNLNEILETVNLSEHKYKKMGELSGGMIRRVGIAQAIIGNPAILVVDEPTAGLDPEERIRFRNLLKNISRNSIVIISSHIVEDIETICDKAGIIFNGNLLEEGDINYLKQITQNKVWELKILKEDYSNFIDKYPIVSSTVENEFFNVKLLADEKPSENATSLNSSLEDTYFYLISKAKKNYD